MGKCDPKNSRVSAIAFAETYLKPEGSLVVARARLKNHPDWNKIAGTEFKEAVAAEETFAWLTNLATRNIPPCPSSK